MQSRHAVRVALSFLTTGVAVLTLAGAAGAQTSGGGASGAGHARGAAAPRGDRAADSAAVAGTVRRYHEALARGDSAAALALLAPGAVVLESGGMETLAEYRSHHLPADIEFARAIPEKRSGILVRMAGDAAWAASTSTAQGTFRGRAVDSSGAELMVLERTSDGWRIAAIHWSSRRRN
jgi:ketosteroid isomerase-like protein